jgi:hypothetical protein
MTARTVVLLLAAASLACAPAPRSGDEVHIAEESAIILWDAASKTQHFIRRASFETQAKDFGFLVPTPSVPELKEADDDAFDFLHRLTTPPPPRETAKSEMTNKAAPAAAAPKVEVIARVQVAGYDAAVLKANDAGALDQWLKANGYASSPELADWYKPYVAKNWIITAFKIAGGAAARSRLEASAVRMSFKAEQPYFPYREPAGAKASGPRLLNVFYVGDARVEGRIGAGGNWPGKAVWSGAMASDDRERLLKLLKLSDVPVAGARLTRFIDSSSPRPGTDDLLFSPSADQSEVRGEYVDHVYGRARQGADNFVAMVLIAAGLVAMLFLWMRWRRKRK